MALKDLLVMVDDTAASAARIDVAAQLAVRNDAHLTALYVVNEPVLPGYIEAELPQEVRDVRRRQVDEQAAQAGARFDETMNRYGLTARSEWRVAHGDPTTAAATHGRYADLIVVGQLDPSFSRDLDVVVPQDLLFEGGRPLLVVPYIGHFKTVGERIVVGWNASREAGRAVGDAMALLSAAKRVVVMATNPKPGPFGLGDEPGADIAKHLSRHGCKVEATHIITEDLEPGDTILNLAADEGCDLIVMGAYGRSRLRELVLGGMTRYMLQHMTVPVLMSH